jgi:hypothetical protein
MRLDFAVLSNSSEVQSNLLYLSGGGWDTGWRSGFPAPFQGALTIRLLAHQTEVNRPHKLEIRFLSEDGAEFAPAFDATLTPGPAPADLPIGWDVPIMLAIGLQTLQIPAPGRYSIEILIDNQHAKSVQFRLIEGAPLPGPQPPSR